MQGYLTGPQLQLSLTGATIVAAKRKGKVLWLELSTGLSWVLHFGMTGCIRIQGVKGVTYQSQSTVAPEWPPRFAKVRKKQKKQKKKKKKKDDLIARDPIRDPSSENLYRTS